MGSLRSGISTRASASGPRARLFTPHSVNKCACVKCRTKEKGAHGATVLCVKRKRKAKERERGREKERRVARLDEAVHERVVGTVGDEEPELLEGDLRVLGTHQTQHGDGRLR